MSNGKRFNLTEWVEDKKNRTLAMIVLVVFVAFGLIVRVISHIGSVGDIAKLPDGGLLAEKGDYVEYEVPYYLNHSVTSSALGVTLAIPAGTMGSGDYLAFQIGSVTYMVGDGNESVKEISEKLYAEAVKSVFGAKENVSVGAVKSGYLGCLAADFCTASVDVQISTKSITLYSIAYTVSVQDISGVTARKLMLYACSEEPGALEEAQVVLKEVVKSIRKADLKKQESGASKEAVDKPLGSDYFYPIDVYWYDASTGYENTVMVISWDNMLDEPGTLEVTGPQGQKGLLNEEYSHGGHYVYDFGVTDGGQYYIHGGTDKQLMNACISVMSMSDYLDVFHYVDANNGEVPDYILNREAEEE